jgi:hypothetical protein
MSGVWAPPRPRCHQQLKRHAVVEQKQRHRRQTRCKDQPHDRPATTGSFRSGVRRAASLLGVVLVHQQMLPPQRRWCFVFGRSSELPVDARFAGRGGRRSGGSCFDNAAAEVPFSSLEWETLSRNDFQDTIHVRSVVVDWCYMFYHPHPRRSAPDGHSSTTDISETINSREGACENPHDLAEP